MVVLCPDVQCVSGEATPALEMLELIMVSVCECLN